MLGHGSGELEDLPEDARRHHRHGIDQHLRLVEPAFDGEGDADHALALAADQDSAKDGRPVPSTVVTLLVTPDDAERIALAACVGSIMLTLRNPLDKDLTETKGTHVAALMGAPEPQPVTKVDRGIRRVVEAPKPAAPPPPSIYQVETIRAAKRLTEAIK